MTKKKGRRVHSAIKEFVKKLTGVSKNNKHYEIYYLIFYIITGGLILITGAIYSEGLDWKKGGLLLSIATIEILLMYYGRTYFSKQFRQTKKEEEDGPEFSEELFKNIEDYGIDINDKEAVNKFLNKMVKKGEKKE